MHDYWPEHDLEPSMPERIIAWVIPILLVCVVAGVFYMWGRKDGMAYAVHQVCREPIAEYYDICE